MDLPPELCARAEQELNEREPLRSECLAKLRSMVPKVIRKSGFQQLRCDDAFLLRFLRHKKFDFKGAYKTLKSYAKFRVKNADLYGCNFTASSGRETWAKLHNCFRILPGRAKDGSVVMTVSIKGFLNLDISNDDDLKHMAASNLYVVERLLEDPYTQVCGVTIFENMEGFTFSEAMSMHMRSSALKKRLIGVWQGNYPIRLRGIHLSYEPSWIDVMFALIRPFLKQKLVDRVKMHGEKQHEFLSYIDSDNLPVELGGTFTGQDTFWDYWENMEKNAEQQ